MREMGERQSDSLEEITSEHLNLSRESSGEHERLTFVDIGHVGLLNDTTDLRFETHVEHAISLIENEVTDVGERDPSTFHHVDETSRSSREEIATLIHGTELRSDIGTSVDDSRSNP